MLRVCVAIMLLVIHTATFAHKTVLVTGGASGIGREMAKAFSEDGWQVYVTSRKEADSLPPNTHALKMDAKNQRDIEQVVATVYEHTGRIDVLINNAGYGLISPVETASKEAVCDQFEVNVFAPLKLTQLVVPIMRKNGGGHIINVSSTSGMRAVPGLGMYAASKKALEGMSEAMSAELTPFNIHVALLEPGTVKNDWAKNAVVGTANGVPQYQKLTKNLRTMLIDKAQTGQQETEVASLALQIAKTQKPQLRYQTNEQSFAVAKGVWNDPTGESIQSKMKELMNTLVG